MDAAYYPDALISEVARVYTTQVVDNLKYITSNNVEPTYRTAVRNFNMGGVIVGAVAGGVGGTSLNGKIYSFIIVNQALTTSDIDNAKFFSANKSGVTL